MFGTPSTESAGSFTTSTSTIAGTKLGTGRSDGAELSHFARGRSFYSPAPRRLSSKGGMHGVAGRLGRSDMTVSLADTPSVASAPLGAPARCQA